jgi:hypothetical protein
MRGRMLKILAACALLGVVVLALILTLWSHWSAPVQLASLGWHG